MDLQADRRLTHLAPAIETREDGRQVVSGYAAVWYDGTPDTEFRVRPGAVERVMPGAFDQTLKEDDILAAVGHNELLGRTSSGTLRLSTDPRGLRYEIDLPDTTAGRDLAEHIHRGDIRGSSFGFRVRGSDGQAFRAAGAGSDIVRELRRVKLLDVGPAFVPAYPGTTCGFRDARDAQDAAAAIDEFQRQRTAEAVRVRARAVEVQADG